MTAAAAAPPPAADGAARASAHRAGGTGLARIPYPPAVLRLRVAGREELAPSMVRVVLEGDPDDVRALPAAMWDDHVRLLLPDADGGLRVPGFRADGRLDWPRPVPPSRKYTVRRVDAERGQVLLDLVVHGSGPGSAWAAGARPGDEAVLVPSTATVAVADRQEAWLFAVDATGLPAVARFLEESPQDAVGRVVVLCDEPTARGYPLAARPGVVVEHVTDPGARLVDLLDALPEPVPGTVLVGAAEAEQVRPLRRWHPELLRLVTAYWKRGASDA